ncbi:small acid-soluble spore protein Tlp [Virgibacillus ihumii]|uniref:small acid-soluble spore protein Tlp n=1 Tax=Virgibacillus ihumii TaxID=2686091 RepID=UPI00157D76A0|nr:small acid-soluble spore protein Tlp [Virgibacillus ihumii]
MPDKYEPKPDDRSDNAEKIENMIHDTLENMDEAEETMEFSSGQEKEQIKAKNKRRQESVKGMRQEMKDEADQ